MNDRTRLEQKKEIKILLKDAKEMHNKMIEMLGDGNNGQSIWLIPEIIDNFKVRKDLIFDTNVFYDEEDDNDER